MDRRHVHTSMACPGEITDCLVLAPLLNSSLGLQLKTGTIPWIFYLFY